MSDIEYSVITSDVIKSFDCAKHDCVVINTNAVPKNIHN